MSKIEDIILEKFIGKSHGGGGSTNASSGGMRNRGKPPKSTMVPASFDIHGTSFDVQEEPIAEAKDPSELPKTMVHLDDLKPQDFMNFLRNYVKKNVDISEKVDGSARISFGVDDGKLWTQSKNGQRKYSSSEYPDEPMFMALKAAHRALESQEPTIVRAWPQNIDFMVGEVLHTKIPNSIEYGPDAIIIHGVHPSSDPKADATQLTQVVNNNLDGWRFEYKNSIPHDQFEVDVTKELQRAEILFRRLQQNPTNRDLKKQFQQTQIDVKGKLLGKLRTSKSAYGPEGGDVEGMVFRDLDTGAMTKLVDKDYFTQLNKFMWHWREMLDKGAKVGEEWHPGVMQNFRNIIADEVLGSSVAKTPGFVKYLVRNYGSNVQGSTPISKADRVLAKYIQANNLMSGDFSARFNWALMGAFREFENLRQQWEENKTRNPEMKFGEKVRRMDPIIIKRTDDAYNQMEAVLQGIKAGMDVANSIGDPLTAKVAFLKLMMGPRFNKLVTEMSGSEQISEVNWKGLAAAAGLAAPALSGEYHEPWYPPDPQTMQQHQDIKPEGVDAWVAAASQETGIQPELIRAIIRVESSGRHDAVSHKGARGYMQLMPDTATEMGVSPHNPKSNILGGARYLRKLAKMFRGNLAKTIGAYNAGPGGVIGKTVDEWPNETQEYLKKVLKHLPRGFNIVKYKDPVAQSKHPRIAEGGQLNRSSGPVDLSGNRIAIPDFEDAAKANESLSAVIGDTIRQRIVEDKSTTVGVTVGRFQPFHTGHAAIIRALAAQFPKVVIFVAGQKPGKKNPFSHETRMKLMEASLKDIWSKLEIYPAQINGKGSGYIPGLASWVAQNYQSTLNGNSNVTVFVGEDRFEDIQQQLQHNQAHRMEPGYFQGNITVQPLKGVSLDDDNAGRISGTRVREALLNDEKDQVRKMLDPNVSTEPAVFEELYTQMRRELGATGSKPVETITDAPVAGPQPEELKEMGMGALETGVGWTRGGSWGSSGWSRAVLAKDMTGDEIYQQSLRAGQNRMLDMTNPGTPNDHMPGEELDHHLDGDDEDAPKTQKEPTDLSDMIQRHLRKLM